MKLAYRRILLKLSGEALAGDKGHGIDSAVTSQIVSEIKEIHDAGAQIGIVIGGGNIYRGASGPSAIGRETGDAMGMLATVINSLALKAFLDKQGVPATVYTAVAVEKVGQTFVAERAVADLEQGRVVIVAGGTGNPYFTTDTAAALRCAEIRGEVILKATKVDGIYDSDPLKNTHAVKFPSISYAEALARNLRIMDATAFSFCMENNIPIIVFKLSEKGNLRACLEGSPVGSIVTKGG